MILISWTNYFTSFNISGITLLFWLFILLFWFDIVLLLLKFDIILLLKFDSVLVLIFWGWLFLGELIGDGDYDLLFPPELLLLFGLCWWGVFWWLVINPKIWFFLCIN